MAEIARVVAAVPDIPAPHTVVDMFPAKAVAGAVTSGTDTELLYNGLSDVFALMSVSVWLAPTAAVDGTETFNGLSDVFALMSVSVWLAPTAAVDGTETFNGLSDVFALMSVSVWLAPTAVSGTETLRTEMRSDAFALMSTSVWFAAACVERLTFVGALVPAVALDAGAL